MSLRSAAATLQARANRHKCLQLTRGSTGIRSKRAFADKRNHAGGCVLVRSGSPGVPAAGDRANDNWQSNSRNSSSTDSGNNSSSSSSSTSVGRTGFVQRWQQDSKRMQEQLKALGAAGVIAYGLFNTLYYTVAFVFVWFTVANVPSGLGFSAAARKAAEVFALVWAGSQVTKLLRAGAALACAPLIDKGLDRLGLHDKRSAYLVIVLGCVVLASVVMLAVIGLHA